MVAIKGNATEEEIEKQLKLLNEKVVRNIKGDLPVDEYRPNHSDTMSVEKFQKTLNEYSKNNMESHATTIGKDE